MISCVIFWAKRVRKSYKPVVGEKGGEQGELTSDIWGFKEIVSSDKMFSSP